LEQFDRVYKFKGYAAIFDVEDDGKDTFRKGAFKEAIKKRGAKGIKLLWQHNDKIIIGELTSIKETKKGLYVSCNVFLTLPKGKEAAFLITRHCLDGLSIGYKPIVTKYKGELREIFECDIKEVSVVTFPMHEQALITEKVVK